MTERIDTALTRMLGIRYPVIMAPMFLVSNAEMVIAALKSGITGSIPALNYRTDAAFRGALDEIRERADGPVGINLIVNKSNIRMKEQLESCIDKKVDYIITSLGSPKYVIEKVKPQGIKVFCDVTDLAYARKVEDMGADALIAVNAEAGGHAGPIPAKVLVPMLVENCNIPVISAGGVGTGAQMLEKLEFGACGVSIGSPFIATTESGVSEGYKNACVEYGAQDIVMTTKISGSPCTVIKTPYVEEIGTEQSWLEGMLNRNRQLKKWAKMLTFYKGMKALEKAAFSATYKTVWCAGPSIEHVHAVEPTATIVNRLIDEYQAAIIKKNAQIAR